jgi:arylsulfatase A-like enzyme
VQRAIRDERLKLIEYCVNGRRTTQLFDLENDPWELQNLAGDSRYTNNLQRLRKLLVQGKEKLDDDSSFWQSRDI